MLYEAMLDSTLLHRRFNQSLIACIHRGKEGSYAIGLLDRNKYTVVSDHIWKYLLDRLGALPDTRQ